MNMKHRYRARD